MDERAEWKKQIEFGILNDRFFFSTLEKFINVTIAYLRVFNVVFMKHILILQRSCYKDLRTNK